MMTLLYCFRHQTCSIYCMMIIGMGIVPDNQYQILFSQCTDWLFLNSKNFFHFCMVSFCHAKNSQTRKNNLEKYIAPLPQLIIMNIFNCFVEFVVSRNTNELYRGYGRLKNFLHPQVPVHPHEISSHPSFISTKNTNVFIVKLLIVWF